VKRVTNAPEIHLSFDVCPLKPWSNSIKLILAKKVPFGKFFASYCNLLERKLPIWPFLLSTNESNESLYSWPRFLRLVLTCITRVQVVRGPLIRECRREAQAGKHCSWRVDVCVDHLQLARVLATWGHQAFSSQSDGSMRDP